MTAPTTNHVATGQAAPAATHPLDRLTRQEIEANRDILDKAGLIETDTRFPLVMLREPGKAQVLAWRPGDAWDRQVCTILLDRRSGEVREVVVSLTERAVVSQRDIDVRAEGQPPIMAEEFDLVEQILWADPAWCAATASDRPARRSG